MSDEYFIFWSQGIGSVLSKRGSKGCLYFCSGLALLGNILEGRIELNLNTVSCISLPYGSSLSTVSMISCVQPHPLPKRSPFTMQVLYLTERTPRRVIQSPPNHKPCFQNFHAASNFHSAIMYLNETHSPYLGKQYFPFADSSR
jgi:hypothetical protein